MSQVELQHLEAGRFAVIGDMNFSTVDQLLDESSKLFNYDENLEIDLVGVQRADSAGLALIIEWMKLARRSGAEIRLLNMPEQMRAISRTSELDEVLSMHE